MVYEAYCVHVALDRAPILGSMILVQVGVVVGELVVEGVVVVADGTGMSGL